jgi:hypothetical protein
MKTVLRYDRGTLRRPTKTPQGFLRVDGLASRSGVFEYMNDDGSIRRELRLDEEVFDPKALAGYEGAPLTDGHPPVPVTTANVKQYEVGTVTSPARRDGSFVATSIVIKDPKTIAKVERGDTGLSAGYAVDLDETPGNHPQFGRYDAIQRNIVINHLAVGVQPRAGNAARIRMDGVAHEIDPQHHTTESAAMANLESDEQIRSLKLQLDEQTKLATERKDALDAAVSEGETAKATVVTLTNEVAEYRAQIAAAATTLETEAIVREKTRADAAEAKVSRFDETFRAAVAARAKLERRADVVMGGKLRMDDLSDREIQATVVKRLDATADTSSAVSDAFMSGRFESLIDSHARNARSQQHVSEVLSAHNTQRADDREAKLAKFRGQGLEPLPNDIRARKDA